MVRSDRTGDYLLGAAAGVLVLGTVGTAYALEQRNSPTSPPPPPSMGLSPVVTAIDATSGALLVGASVEFGTQTETTDTYGEATFSGLAAGDYIIVVDATGYSSTTQAATLSESTLMFTVQMQPISQTCATLEPATIIASPNQSVELAWMVSVTWADQVTEVGIIPSNPTSCVGANCADVSVSGGVTDWSSDTWMLNVTGQVVDSADSPVCGIPVNLSIGQASIPWQTADGLAGTANFSQMISEGPPGPAVTDANGNFTFPLYISLTITQGNASALGTNLAGSGGGPVSVLQTLTYIVAGTIMSFTESLSCRLLVCSQNSPDGC